MNGKSENIRVPMEMGREREWETCAAHSAPASFSISSGCRRAASFPFFGDTTIQPSSLKVRSQSESEGLNKIRLSQVKFDTLRSRLCSTTINERDEGSDYQSNSSSSSECDGEEADFYCQGALEINKEEEKRKNVRFADDCGKELYVVRVATEPSDCPPKLSPNILRRYRGDSFDEDHHSHEPAPIWTLMFKQPAADYAKFRGCLAKNMVALENVVLNNDGYKMTGMIKVNNLAFEKSVIVRYSMNGWASYMDKQAMYQPSTSKVYDTFKFEIDLPTLVEKIHKIEFCICYKTNGTEYWDSNSGTNYAIQCEQNNPTPKRSYTFGGQKYLDRDDAYKLDYNDWSKFASWKCLSTNGPYW